MIVDQISRAEFLGGWPTEDGCYLVNESLVIPYVASKAEAA